MREFLSEQYRYLKFKNKPRIFCIGRNKTGTTSIKKALREFNFTVGNQRYAERLLPFYLSKNFKPIVKHCRYAEAFQDSPFSYPETFRHLDKSYPNSKFILTVRDSPEQWYSSVTRFHARRFGGGEIPTAQQLKNADYVEEGWMWKMMQGVYGVTEDDPYDKEKLTTSYMNHNEKVKAYFKDRPEDLLVINLKEGNSYKHFCSFLGVKPLRESFPHENKTANINANG